MKYISREMLRILFQRIIQKLEVEELDKIEIDEDLYRFIPTDQWATFEKDVIMIGSLYDDIAELEKLAKDKDRFCTYVDFDRVASVLRAISEKENPANN